MKKFFSIMSALALVALTLVSCKKDEPFPSHLAGTWTYSNASTGYTGSFVVEDIAGGQAGYFELKSPSGLDTTEIEGPFKYDSAKGVGTLTSELPGGFTVTVNAYRGNTTFLDIILTQVVSGGSSEKFSGKFTSAAK